MRKLRSKKPIILGFSSFSTFFSLCLTMYHRKNTARFTERKKDWATGVFVYSNRQRKSVKYTNLDYSPWENRFNTQKIRKKKQKPKLHFCYLITFIWTVIQRTTSLDYSDKSNTTDPYWNDREYNNNEFFLWCDD